MSMQDMLLHSPLLACVVLFISSSAFAQTEQNLLGEVYAPGMSRCELLTIEPSGRVPLQSVSFQCPRPKPVTLFVSEAQADEYREDRFFWCTRSYHRGEILYSTCKGKPDLQQGK